MFLENKYTRWYFNIVKIAQQKSINENYEKHHIIPRSLGGTNDSTNIVKLTLRQHFIVHRLLVYMTTGDARRRMAYAAWQMARRGKFSRAYDTLRNQLAESYVGRPGPKGSKNGRYGKKSTNLLELNKSRTGIPLSDEHKMNIRKGMVGKSRRPRSEETKEKIRLANIGKRASEETKAKMRGRTPWNKRINNNNKDSINDK